MEAVRPKKNKAKTSGKSQVIKLSTLRIFLTVFCIHEVGVGICHTVNTQKNTFLFKGKDSQVFTPTI